MGAGRQVKLLLWKNWTVRRRQRVKHLIKNPLKVFGRTDYGKTQLQIAMLYLLAVYLCVLIAIRIYRNVTKYGN